MDLERGKLKCQECGWFGVNSNLLTGRNPLIDYSIPHQGTAQGCPQCFHPSPHYFEICDEPMCWDVATCRTTRKNNIYRRTCRAHEIIEEIER